jgi:hypothetical protein
MPIPKKLEQWKIMWDSIINNPSFRKKFSCGGEYDSSDTKIIRDPCGTIYIHGEEGEGHFIAYEVVNGIMFIFDSAQNRYSKWLNNDILEQIIKRSRKKKSVIVGCHPQIHKEDSFCQTWSLAWLTKELRPLVIGVNTEEYSIRILFTICKQIINDDRFDKKEKKFITFTNKMTLETFIKIFEDPYS